MAQRREQEMNRRAVTRLKGQPQVLPETGMQQLEATLEQIVATVDGGRREFYEVADEARSEWTRMSSELIDLRMEIATTISQVEQCEREERMARLRLMEVSRDFKNHDEKDIRDAYENARRLQANLAALREKERQLRLRRDELERMVRQVEDIAQRAESLVEHVSMAMKVLQGNLGALSAQAGEASVKQQMGAYIIQAQEEERLRVSRELHDGPAQNMANIVMRLELIERLWERDQQRARREISDLKKVVKHNLGDIRRIIFDLRPMALDDLGLAPAIRRYLAEYGERFGMDIEFVFYGDERRLDPALEVAIFRVIQEAITNVRKHARATRTRVELRMGGAEVGVVVHDDGKGFDRETLLSRAGRSFGMIGMKERVHLFGGEFHVESAPGQGTRISLQVPLAQEGEREHDGESEGSDS